MQSHLSKIVQAFSFTSQTGFQGKMSGVGWCHSSWLSPGCNNDLFLLHLSGGYFLTPQRCEHDITIALTTGEKSVKYTSLSLLWKCMFSIKSFINVFSIFHSYHDVRCLTTGVRFIILCITLSLIFKSSFTEPCCRNRCNFLGDVNIAVLLILIINHPVEISALFNCLTNVMCSLSFWHFLCSV